MPTEEACKSVQPEEGDKVSAGTELRRFQSKADFRTKKAIMTVERRPSGGPSGRKALARRCHEDPRALAQAKASAVRTKPGVQTIPARMGAARPAANWLHVRQCRNTSAKQLSRQGTGDRKALPLLMLFASCSKYVPPQRRYLSNTLLKTSV